MHALLSSLPSRWRAFDRSTEGNVAIMFAIVIIPVLGLIGFSVDYSRYNALRTKLQAAADAAALAVAKTAAQNPGGVSAASDAYVRSTGADPAMTIDAVTGTYTKNSDGATVEVDATATFQTSFLPVLGFAQQTIHVTSTTTWGSTKLRVALALDNTGSMKDDGKMGALKTATTNLLTQLKSAAAQSGDVYVSIVPFVKDVNVGRSNYNASWIDWTDWDKENTTRQWSCNGWTCSWTYVTASHSTWNGCVTDRGKSSGPNPSGTGQGYDQNVTAPGSTSQSKFPADQYSACPQEMIGLTDVLDGTGWSKMTGLVDNMYPNGSTNQPIGLVWAWQSLVGGGPLATRDYLPDTQYTPIIILLSDGLNTQDRWYGNGRDHSSETDARMYDSNGAGTCANIKNSPITINGEKRDIVIYTVQVNTGGDPESALLKNCASSTETEPKGQKFFHLKSATDIISTFDTIGTSLSQLRVSK